MKKLVFIFLFTQIVVAQGGMFGKNPIINKENWNKQRVHWGYYLGFNSLDFKFDYLSVAKDIEVQLDFHQQLWVIDYLQHCWKGFLSDHNWLLKLEDAKNSLLKMASPRLVWEVLLFPD